MARLQDEKKAGKKSSSLDDIRPEIWSARLTDELLELLWVLEGTTAMETELEKVLNKIVAGHCFTNFELPIPQNSERNAPGTVATAGGLLELMGINDSDDDNDNS